LKLEYSTGDEPFDFIARGMGYHNCAYLWHAPSLDPDQLLNPAEVGDIRLNILTKDSSTAASGTNFVFMDRVVSG
jgi:hypothetical protein